MFDGRLVRALLAAVETMDAQKRKPRVNDEKRRIKLNYIIKLAKFLVNHLS
jgi:hypothetical protein